MNSTTDETTKGTVSAKDSDFDSIADPWGAGPEVDPTRLDPSADLIGVGPDLGPGFAPADWQAAPGSARSGMPHEHGAGVARAEESGLASASPSWAGAQVASGERPSHGLNVDQCRDIAEGFIRDELSLDEIASTAQASVRRIHHVWDGPDAEKFVAQWARGRSQIEDTAQSLRRMRQLLQIAIDEQVEASRD